MLASELALGGVGVRLLEEHTDMPNITRAFAVHARTLELLDARGMADEPPTESHDAAAIAHGVFGGLRSRGPSDRLGLTRYVIRAGLIEP
jgi:2-polyprenyl-6-methoxyphenol hydroxylase-like FAD-dependent oxidoreductase